MTGISALSASSTNSAVAPEANTPCPARITGFSASLISAAARSRSRACGGATGR